MTTPLPLEVLRPALVGVIQTGSERDHNSEAGSEPFDKIPLAWITCEFYDEHSVVDFYRGIKDRRFSAVCFGSNALFNSAIYGASCDAAQCIADASEDGMGIVLLQQFLPVTSSRACEFLPSFHRLEYRGLGYRRIDQIQVADRVLGPGEELSLDARTFGNREPVLWSTVTPSSPRAWCPLATVRAQGEEHVVLMRTRAARGRIIVSALPLDWLSDHRLLTYVIGLSVRSLGTLYVHSEREHQTQSISLELLLGRSVAEGGHLSSVTVDDPGKVSSRGNPFADFGHIVVSDEWGWPELTGLYHERIRARLENGGSVSAYGSSAGPGGERVFSVVRGRPIYLYLAHQFAAWFEANRPRFLDAPTTQVRALAVAVRAVHDSTVDPDEIPPFIALDEIDRSLGPYFELRLHGADNADGHVLPTASLASAMLLLKHPQEEIVPLLRWIERGEYVSSFAAIQQAALWLPEVHVPPGRVAKSDLETIYECLLAVRASPGNSDQLDQLLAILSDPGAVMSRKAIIAESLVGFGHRETLVRAAGAARQLQNDLELALSAEHAPLEVICLLTAFLVRVHAAQEPTAGYSRVDAPPNGPTLDLDADLRRTLEGAHSVAEALQDQLRATRVFGAKAVGWTITLAIVLIVAAATVVVISVEAEWPTWAGVLLPALALASAVFAYVGFRAGQVDCEPRALRSLREIWHR